MAHSCFVLCLCHAWCTDIEIFPVVVFCRCSSSSGGQQCSKRRARPVFLFFTIVAWQGGGVKCQLIWCFFSLPNCFPIFPPPIGPFSWLLLLYYKQPGPSPKRRARGEYSPAVRTRSMEFVLVCYGLTTSEEVYTQGGPGGVRISRRF